MKYYVLYMYPILVLYHFCTELYTREPNIIVNYSVYSTDSDRRRSDRRSRFDIFIVREYKSKNGERYWRIITVIKLSYGETTSFHRVPKYGESTAHICCHVSAFLYALCD